MSFEVSGNRNEAAIRQTQILQYQVGGMVAFVEAEDKEKYFLFMKIMVLNGLIPDRRYQVAQNHMSLCNF